MLNSNAPVKPTVFTASQKDGFYCAAIALGIDEKAAGYFSYTGKLQLGDRPMLIQPRSNAANDDWLAVYRVTKPANLEATRWSESLLAANGQLMQLGRWAFALDEDHAALLVQRIPSDHCEDGRLLAAHLYGAMIVTRALVDGAQGPQARNDSGPGKPLPASVAEAPPLDMEQVLADAMKVAPFTPTVQALLTDAVHRLGGDTETVKTLFDSGSVRIRDLPVILCADADGHELTAAVALHEATLATPDMQRGALAKNLELVSLAGVAAARLNGSPVLLGRYCVRNTESGSDLAEWLHAFAALAEAVGGLPDGAANGSDAQTVH